MGILNVTPDSFSDGGTYLDVDAAAARMARMASDGAAIIDVGAESTRPGAAPVGPDEQLRRLTPLLDRLARDRSMAWSIDTSAARVAAAALAAGAALVNDVTAGRADPALLALVASRDAHVCLVHMRGTPRTMQADPAYADVVAEVAGFLSERIAAARAAGVADGHILIDPGIGFGKTLEHNLHLLSGLPRLCELGCPVVIGASRKGMFGALLGRAVDDRLAGSLGAAVTAVARGASIVRVHDVRETADALRVWTAIERGGST